MQIFKEIIFSHPNIAHFPEFQQNLKHGFSWGIEAGNFSFAHDEKPIQVRIRQKKFFGTLELGSMSNAVQIVPEHNTRIVDLDEDLIKVLKPTPAGKYIKGDAIFTKLNSIPLIVKPADCTTMIVYAESNDGSKITGLIHSGWRGVDKELPRLAIEHLIAKYNCDPKNIHLGLVPHISFEHRTYEVIEKFNLKEKWQELGFLLKKGELYHFNESGCALDQYIKAGVPEENITNYDINTYEATQKGLTFSNKYSVNQERLGKPRNEGRFIVATCLRTFN